MVGSDPRGGAKVDDNRRELLLRNFAWGAKVHALCGFHFPPVVRRPMLCTQLYHAIGRGLAAIVAFTTSIGWAHAVDVPPGVVYEADVVYGRGGDRDLRLDMARPETVSGKLPAVIVIHGGGWREGNRKQHTAHILDFAKRGYLAVTIEYRFCPKDRFPAQVEDARCAVRFLRAHAEKYQINTKRIGAVGVSAGAHLAMMLATLEPGEFEGKGGWDEQSSRVKAVVSFVGPTDLPAEDIPALALPLVRDFIGGTREDKLEAYKQASPLYHVSNGDSAMLLFAGTLDPLIPTNQATKMADALTKQGVPGRVELLLGQGHGFDGPTMQHCLGRMNEFLEQQLKK